MYLAFCFGAELPKEKSLVLYHFWLVSAVVSFSKVFVGSVGIAALALVVPACPLADRSAEEVCKSCKPCHFVPFIFSEIKWLRRYLTNARKRRDSGVTTWGLSPLPGVEMTTWGLFPLPNRRLPIRGLSPLPIAPAANWGTVPAA